MRWAKMGVMAAAMVGIVGAGRPAYAIKEFYKELEAKYVKRDSKKETDIDLLIAFEQAQCTICHPRDNKQQLTPYGGQVGWRINKFDKGNKKKIQAALKELEDLRSDSRNPKSPTYGELFRQGRLPPSLMEY